MSINNPELVFYNGFKLNEAMYWDRKHKYLYFVSIRNHIIYKLDPDTGYMETYMTDGPVGGVVTDDEGNIIEAEKSGIYKINPVRKEKTFIADVLPYDKMRYNHIIMDSKGRILVDVMGDEERHAGEGGLYQIDGGSIKCLVNGTTVANGVVLNTSETKLYFTDTPTRLVMEYDYDIETGDISNGRVIIDMNGEKGLPDGLMLDKDENYMWIAEWASSTLSKWDIQKGVLIDKVILPAPHVTSSIIGGKDMDFIFIATAKSDEADRSISGGIFRIML